MAVQHGAGVGVEAHVGSGCNQSRARCRARSVRCRPRQRWSLPATITMPVLTRVSQATRALVSCCRMASSTASGDLVGDFIRMAFETDSEANRPCLVLDS